MGALEHVAWLRPHGRGVLVALAYVALAHLGYAFYFPGSDIATFWPASGFLLAVLVREAPPGYPRVLLYVGVAHVVADTLLHGVPFPVSLGFVLADSLEATLAALLLRRLFGERFALDRLDQAIALALIAGLLATPLAAMIGGSVGFYGLGRGDHAQLVKTWWFGDALGILLVAPALLAWPSRERIVRASSKRIVEAFVLVVLALGTAQLTFGVSVVREGELGFPYLVVPLLLWAAIRFGTSGAALLSLAITTVALWNSRHGRGPFVNIGTTPYDHVVALQSFVAVTYSAQLVAALHAQNARSLAALASSEAMYKSLARAVPVALFRTDASERVSYVNARFAELTGSAAEDCLGRPLRSFMHRDDAKALEGEGLLRTLDVRIVAKDGRTHFVIGALVPEEDADGSHVGFVGTLTDVTDRRQADAARKVLEAELRQAQKMEAVGRLAGGVAHDFNNMLTAILGYAFVVGERLDEGSPLKGYVEQVTLAGKRAAALTHQLLAFSRKQVLEPRVLDVNAVVRDTEDMLRRLMSEEITLRTELDAALGAVEADPNQLVQVLMNLAVNARDAMEGAPGTLTIETRGVERGPDHTVTTEPPEFSPHGYVLLSVRDTGHGMDEETQRHLFEPFFTTKESGKGTGLGLATVYGIVRQSGGAVVCSSRVDLGTRFDVYLPCVDARPTSDRPASIAPAPERTREGTILLVEDDDDVRSLARHVLEGAGYQVLAARHAAEAESLSRRFDGDLHLLLTDVVMPETAGPELARRLVRARPDLRVLYVSGYSDHPSLHTTLGPHERFLAKPFTPNALLTNVDEHIARKRTRHPPSSDLA